MADRPTPDDALSGEDAALQPFLQPRPVADAILRRLSIPQRVKWARYFEQYGCLICSRKNLPYAASGLCRTCLSRTVKRLKKITADDRKEPGR